MAAKSLNELVASKKLSAQADAACWQDRQFQADKRTAALQQARMRLSVKVQLASETAKAEHAIDQARANLIANMTESERADLISARAVLAGIGQDVRSLLKPAEDKPAATVADSPAQQLTQ